MHDEPRYLLLAREAEMLFTGGCGLEKNPQRSGRARQTCPWGGTVLDSERRNSCLAGSYNNVQD